MPETVWLLISKSEILEPVLLPLFQLVATLFLISQDNPFKMILKSFVSARLGNTNFTLSAVFINTGLRKEVIFCLVYLLMSSVKH